MDSKIKMQNDKEKFKKIQIKNKKVN